jgi:hypothetical protein
VTTACFDSSCLVAEFRQLDTKAPAELAAVVEVIVHLSALSDQHLVELVSGGKLGELFPFSPSDQTLSPDAAADETLQETSSLPLSRDRRAALIASSVSASSTWSDRLSAALDWQARMLRSNKD